MKKYVKTDKYLVTLCLALLVLLASGIASLCCLKSSAAVGVLPVSAFLGVICGVALVAYLIALVATSAAKISVKHHCLLSFEIVVVATLLIALSPLALIFWAVESVCDKICEKSAKKQKSVL